MKQQKRVLIISYYWPPSGGAGVQRWLKFAKYLPQFGYTPVVYTPSNPHYPMLDETLAEDIPSEVEIVKHPIWEPYSFYKKWMGMKKGERVQHGFIAEKGQSAWKQKLSTWVRGNFFIPDARKFWVGPSIKFLDNYLKNNPVDAVVSTGPPHSMHLIGLGVKAKTDLPWLADFRDPWTEIDFYEQLMLTKWADATHRRLEAKVLKSADKVVTIGWHGGKRLELLGAENVDIITNGFDEDDVPQTIDYEANEHFELMHIGSLNKDRNPHDLWAALKVLVRENAALAKKLRITLIGKLDSQVLQSVEEHGLAEYLNKIPYLPHAEIFPKLQSASVLVLALNDVPSIEGIVTGKIFEYLAARRPIICIGSSTGDAAKIVAGAEAGQSVNFGEQEKLKKVVSGYFEKYLSDGLQFDSGKIQQYSRKSLTADLVSHLDGLVDQVAEK
ncbi:MAG: glycosyltransferase [Bacteroidota bacterium]